MSKWIDFGALRRELNFEEVLAHYGVAVDIRDTEKGRQHSGACPLKTCKGGKSAKKVFSANLDRGIWQCFSCKERGNALDLIILMEGFDRSKGDEVRKAARIAKEKFVNGEEKNVKKVEQSAESGQSAEADAPYVKTLINEPLDFTLQSLDPSHRWFAEYGLAERTVEHFGLGFCKKGWLKGRIAIPLRSGGKLIGYAGRLLSEDAVTERNPMYVFPKVRIHNGIRHEFRTSGFLYNYDTVEPTRRLFITSSIEAVWALWQQGYTVAVSVMGEICHATQRRALLAAIQSDGIAGIATHVNEGDSGLIPGIIPDLAVHCAVRLYIGKKSFLPMDSIALNRLLGKSDLVAL